MLSSLNLNGSIMNSLSFEYKKAKETRLSENSQENINYKQKTVRIFISSTFRDFHNERNILVTKVFPRLREWCANHGLHLVECDLRWGIPADSTGEQTLMICFDEIEKGRHECNDMNFFLGLIGDRYGWIPDETDITDNIRKKYKWVDGCSVTIMEIMHGLIRTLTPNGLLMIRLSDFVQDLPDEMKPEFVESDPTAILNLNLVKDFLGKEFTKKPSINFYNVSYDGIVYDRFIDKERVNFGKMEEFEIKVEQHFKKCIKENFLPHVDAKTENVDEVHEIMVECLTKQSPITHGTFHKLYNKLSDVLFNNNKNQNPIFILSGKAGTGKSTILAYCAKELKKLGNCDSFFHSFSCTSNSMYNSTISERLYRFLSVEHLKATKSFCEKINKITNLLENGPKRQDKDLYYVFLDGIDEMCADQNLEWIPKTTSKRIVIIVSCLLESHPTSFYSKLISSDKSIIEISIDAMHKNQLCEMVTNYLDSFGKKLDPDQMNCLMSFENSNNPLWLISACEELRIHGDYRSLKKFILSLPTTIFELNKMVIERLLKQDTDNILKTFLQLLVISKSGLWETLIKDILATKLGNTQPVSHSLWSEIICHLKGFLLFQSSALPLIKFRHRVMKAAIENELDLTDESRLALHYEMSVFFEKAVNNTGDLFLADFVYHLIKSNSRNRFFKFMRSNRSWKIFKNPYIRSRIVLSMRCIQKVQNLSFQKTQELSMCKICAGKSGELSEYGINKNSCFFCGTIVFNNNNNISKLFPCQFHKSSNSRIVCNLCDSPIIGQSEYLKICQLCKSQNLTETCGVIVKEADILYHQQLSFTKAVYNIELLI